MKILIGHRFWILLIRVFPGLKFSRRTDFLARNQNILSRLKNTADNHGDQSDGEKEFYFGTRV